MPCIFLSCSDAGSPTYNPDVGPFDENGNYVEAWADNPPARGSQRKVVKPRSVAPRAEPRPSVRETPRPVNRPSATRPKTTRHIVKKGDTLYGLAKRYGTSISAIKRANRMTSNTVMSGKSYVIPR